MIFQKAITQPIRSDQSWESRWEGADRGLITCWEAGREMANAKPENAALARSGELLILPWKGGVDKKAKLPKKREKIGALNYVAMWQGLRGEDLYVDTAQGTVLTCTATGFVITYYFDILPHLTGLDDEEQLAA
jgi:hypothetical protein